MLTKSVLGENEAVLKRIEICEDGTTNIANPLQWWQGNATRFPRLAILAQKLLAVQATERLFSAAGLTIAKDRANLTPDNAAMLIFLHENMPIVRAWRSVRALPDI